jgi:hypothetical protein
VQQGRCGSEGNPVLEVTDEDRMLSVDNDGLAEAVAEVPGMPLPEDGEYSIAVLASPDNRDFVIACGNFAPPPVTPSQPLDRAPAEPREPR